ncbi:hypothetical protein TrCOL_g12127 [Triparma columacea]|uniref:Fe2OG dioxygenase domain-containing protein n=1 Tax=Triparma columacea TaxID=722753 RepID=A0A9W7G102_9STRA|nr:hypothetical protein TrCOL_g12127 [Triparma columacea]
MQFGGDKEVREKWLRAEREVMKHGGDMVDTKRVVRDEDRKVLVGGGVGEGEQIAQGLWVSEGWVDCSGARVLMDAIDEKMGDGGGRRSTIVGGTKEGEEQKEVDEELRTSETCWFGHEENEVLKGIAERAASYAGVPISCAESFQASRYSPGGFYSLHTDNVDSFNDLEAGGRWGTLIVYLNGGMSPSDDGERRFEGGETEFPYASGGPVLVTPSTGRGAFFHNVAGTDFPITRGNMHSLTTEGGMAHGGRKVEGEGRKYIITLWFHADDIKK